MRDTAWWRSGGACAARWRSQLAFTPHCKMAGGGRVAFSTKVALRTCLLWNYNPCCSIEPRVEGRWLSAIPLCACEDVEYHVACPARGVRPFRCMLRSRPVFESQACRRSGRRGASPARGREVWCEPDPRAATACYALRIGSRCRMRVRVWGGRGAVLHGPDGGRARWRVCGPQGPGAGRPSDADAPPRPSCETRRSQLSIHVGKRNRKVQL